MEHNVEVKPISQALGEVYHVHDPVGFLQKIETFVVLLLLDEVYSAVVEFMQYDGNLVL